MDLQAARGPAGDGRWTVPTGFVSFTVGGRTGVVKAELERDLRTLMVLPFSQLATQRDARRIASGRAGPVHLPFPESEDRVLIRPYAHGGLLGGMGGRIFKSPQRALTELEVSHHAHGLELPVAPLLGVSMTERTDGQWEMEAWSRWLPNAANLTACLPVVSGEAAARRALLSAAADAVRACQDAGLIHHDLNARNLIAERLPGAWRVLVIDLDRAQLAPPLAPEERARQLRRLYRSTVKEGLLPTHLTDGEFAEFARAATGGALDGEPLAGFMHSCRRAAFWHGLLWRLQRLRRP